MHERIDRHGDLLAAMGRTLQSLDSGLDERLASAVRSELGAQMAGMEERIAQRMLARTDRGSACVKPSPEGQTRRQGVSARTAEPAGCSRARDTSGEQVVSADHDHAPVPPKTSALYASGRPATDTLKHSFIRRFARANDRQNARESPMDNETYADKPPGLMARLLENVFGICEPDPKVGKEGSKVIHPQSNFHTGVQDADALIFCTGWLYSP